MLCYEMKKVGKSSEPDFSLTDDPSMDLTCTTRLVMLSSRPAFQMSKRQLLEKFIPVFYVLLVLLVIALI